MKAVELESERLFLKPLSQKHLSLAYVNWLNDIEVNTYLESGGNYTLQLLADFLKEQEQKDILFAQLNEASNDPEKYDAIVSNATANTFNPTFDQYLKYATEGGLTGASVGAASTVLGIGFAPKPGLVTCPRSL